MKNTLLLTIDTLRRDVMGCYGNDQNLSPFIDSVAKEGMLFTNHYTAAPYTQASFPAILTGSYYFDYPTVKNKLAPERTLVSEVVKRSGVVTAGYHSNPYLCSFFGWNRGWDSFYDSMDDQVTPMSPYIRGDVLNKKVENWLGNYKLMHGDKPFFLWVHYMDVHEPYIPSQENIEKVDPSLKITDDEMFALFKDVVLPRDASKPETVELLHKLYKAHVIEIDNNTRALFDSLKKHGFMDNTNVVITTDHGDEFGDHGSLSHDGKFFDELVHCPLIVWGQGSGACDNLVSGVDISPTIVNLFGRDPEPAFAGQSILPTDSFQAKPVFGEAIGKLKHKVQPTDKPAMFAHDGRYKVTYRIEDQTWEMYDMEADPQENNNIIDSSDKAGDMKALLKPRIERDLK